MTPTEALAAFRSGDLSATEAARIIYAPGAAPVRMGFEERETLEKALRRRQ